MDDPIGLYCLEKCVPSLRALPHGFDARLAVPLPGEEPAELLVLLPPALQTSVGYTACVGASAKVRGS